MTGLEVDEKGLAVGLKNEEVKVMGEVLEVNVCTFALGEMVLTILIGWMILKFPGVEEIEIGSTLNTLVSPGVTVKDLGARVGATSTEDKLWKEVVAGVVSCK